jgi:hypothetical protein
LESGTGWDVMTPLQRHPFLDLLLSFCGVLVRFELFRTFCLGHWDNLWGRTSVTNSTLLVSQLPTILSSRVESFSVRKYDENGEKQRKGMLTVLEMLREKYDPPATPAVPACLLLQQLHLLKSLTFSGYRPWGTLA